MLFKDKSETEYVVKHTKIFLVFIILLAVVIGIVIASIIVFYYHEQTTDKIQAGVFIKGINVSGLKGSGINSSMKIKFLNLLSDFKA